MPQLSAFPYEYPQMTSLRIDVEQWPATDQSDEMRITTRLGLTHRVTPWVNVTTLTSLERDLLQTYLTETVSAWRYGERPRDVGRAQADVVRMARAHAAEHEF